MKRRNTFISTLSLSVARGYTTQQHIVSMGLSPYQKNLPSCETSNRKAKASKCSALDREASESKKTSMNVKESVVKSIKADRNSQGKEGRSQEFSICVAHESDSIGNWRIGAENTVDSTKSAADDAACIFRRSKSADIGDGEANIDRKMIKGEINLQNVVKSCQTVLSEALHLHYEKEKPHLALPMYRASRRKLTSQQLASCDTISDAFIRVDVNYAKCIEDCFEHLFNSHTKVFVDLRSKHFENASTRVHYRAWKGMLRASELYREAIEQLVDRGKASSAIKLQLRLVECYRKIDSLKKAKGTLLACKEHIPSAESQQYDIGLLSHVEWNIPLYDIFAAFYLEPIEKGLQTLHAHIKDPCDLSQEAIWYANIFFAKRSVLFCRHVRQIAGAYENALRVKPNCYPLMIELAHFLQHMSSQPHSSIDWYAESIKYLRKNIDLPNIENWILPHTLHNLANAYLAIGKPEFAYPMLQEAIELYSIDKSNYVKTYKAQLVLAGAFERCGLIDQALSTYKEIIFFARQAAKCHSTLQIDVMDQWSFLNAGEVYCRFAVLLKSINRSSDARQLFTDALLLKDTDLATRIECIYSYGDVLRRDGRSTQAALLDDYLFAIVMQNGDKIRLPWKSWQERITQLDASSRFTQALETYDFISGNKCYFSPTESVDIARKYAEYLQMHKQYERASALYEKSLSLGESNPYSYVQHAWCLAKLGRAKQAETVFRQGLSFLETHNSDKKWDECFCIGEFGVFLHERDRYAEAVEQYLKAINAKSSLKSVNYAQTCANLGVLSHTQGKTDEREKWFSAACAQKPVQISAWFLCIDTYITSEEVELGLKVAKEMLQLFPKHTGSISLRMAKLLATRKPLSTYQVASMLVLAMKAELTTACQESKPHLQVLQHLCIHTQNLQALAEFAMLLNYKMRQYSEAELCYEILHKRVPSDINIALHYGKLAVDKLEKLTLGRQLFEHVLKLDERCLLAYEYLADYYLTKESDVDAAEDIYLQAIHRLDGAQYISMCYRYALFLHNQGGRLGQGSIDFEGLGSMNLSNSEALIAQAVYLSLFLDESDRNIAQVQFIKSVLKADSQEESEVYVKPLLNEKHIALCYLQCTNKIAEIARAIQQAAKNASDERSMDIYASLSKKSSSLFKKTRDNMIESTFKWRLQDFLFEPVHELLLEQCTQGIELTENQLKQWDNVKKIDKLFKDAIALEPGNTCYLQHYAFFLANWMTNIPEAGKAYLKCISLKPRNTACLRTAISFFQQYGLDFGISSFIDIARVLHKELIDASGKEVANIERYIEFLQSIKDDTLIQKLHRELQVVLEDGDKDKKNLEEILHGQDTELKNLLPEKE